MGEQNGPAVITDVVVQATDLAAALEARERRDSGACLRITPPFAPRMRARLHVEQAPSSTDPEPVCLPPEMLVESACPDPPSPDSVEDDLRNAADERYTVERHRERYESALREWRETVTDSVVDSTTLPGRSHDVTVTVIGDVER